MVRQVQMMTAEFDLPYWEDTTFQLGADYIGAGNHPSFRRIIHVSVLELDEHGTTAAAATVALNRSAALSMKVDHPLVLAVYDSGSGSILFLGVIRDPTQ